MEYTTVTEWITTEHGHQPSVDDQLLTADWFYENDVTKLDDEQLRTSTVEDELDDVLDHAVPGVLNNLEDIDVLWKDESTSQSFIQVERTGQIFHSPEEDEFPASLYEEMSRLLYDIYLREGLNERGPFPGQLHPPTIAPVADGGRTPFAPYEDQPCAFREFVADALSTESSEVEPADVETKLIEPVDIADQMTQFDDLVETIKDSDDVSRGLEYDQVGWRNAANQWALSETATRMRRNNSLEDF